MDSIIFFFFFTDKREAIMEINLRAKNIESYRCIYDQRRSFKFICTAYKQMKFVELRNLNDSLKSMF